MGALAPRRKRVFRNAPRARHPAARFFFLVSPLYLSQFFISLPFHLHFPKRRNLAKVKLQSVQGKARPPQEEPPGRKMRKRDRYRALVVPRDAREYKAENTKFRPAFGLRTRRGPRFEGSAAGETRVFCIHLKREDEKCVAHPKKRRLREGQSMPCTVGRTRARRLPGGPRERKEVVTRQTVK